MALGLDTIFSDKLVLPLGKTFQISGWSAAEIQIQVTIGQQIRKVMSTANGRWNAVFQPINDGRGVYTIQVDDGYESVIIHELRFGLVFLMAGQSNIEYEIQNDHEYAQIRQQTPLANVYYYNVPKIEYVSQDGTVTPQNLRKPTWNQLCGDNMAEMSAIGYWLSQELQRRLPQTAIGIVDCYKGGTSISSWVSEDVLRSDTTLIKTFLTPFEAATTGKTVADYAQEMQSYQRAVNQHNTDLAAFQAANPKISLSDAKNHVGHTPWPPPLSPTSFLRPCGLYHTMMCQVQHYTFNQVVWYQGENDASQPDIYQVMLTKLIQSWRKMLADTSLVFNIIQLPGYEDEPFEAWPKIRQAQLTVANLQPNVNLISGSDTGERHNIHPTSKRQLGERIGRLLSGQDYHQTPVVIDIQRIGNDVVFNISQVHQLEVRPNTTMQVKVGHKWVQRIVRKIDDQRIVLHDCAEVTAVRYQYENYTQLTIFNELGDPLTPFSYQIEGNESNATNWIN